MKLKMYNTLTNEKEEFRPIEDGKVKIYVCGVTVYDEMHMGHARSIVIFDMIVRYLRYKGYDVTHVTNFTDVDDKIIDRANKLGVPPLELSQKYIEHYFRDIDTLKVAHADFYPKASDTIDEIIQMIQEIMDNGYAYESNGSVYFSMGEVEDYGVLSGQKIEELRSSGEDTEDKRSPMDFALWKAAKPKEISWESPWGPGRPGWHIECSVMSREYLGDLIDIHGGGNDLVFPHHENEILQTRSVAGTNLAKYWIHNGMLELQGEKMSKSLDNFFTVEQVLNDFTPETVRFYLLNTHYRKPLSFSDQALEEAASSLQRLHNTYRQLKDLGESGDEGQDVSELVNRTRDQFLEQMDDDFNSRAAVSTLFDLAREANRLMGEGRLGAEGALSIISLLEDLDQILKILPEEGGKPEISEDLVEILIEVREELRTRENYDLADLIRDRLDEMGIVLEDTKEGARWKQKR